MHHIDRTSSTWQAVLEWAQNKRDGEVERLIGGAYPEQDERIRGRIQAIDELLDLANG
jgi:hypothetical protein